MIGLLGKKLGMTRIFTDSASVPVTVVSVDGNRVAQIKTAATDGYEAAQVAFGAIAPGKVKPVRRGHLAKFKVGAARHLREFRLNANAAAATGLESGQASGQGLESGQSLGADVFEVGQIVDVVGTSKGKGFAGVIKRHHFRSNRASHGNSRAHRKPGSTGQCQDPGRTFPGKKMPGRLGGKRRTIQNLQIARVDTARNLLMIRGAIPGAPGGYIMIKRAVKAKTKAAASGGGGAEAKAK